MSRKIFAFVFLLSIADPSRIEVKVKQGRILGARETTLFDDRVYFAFYRVPYAQRPITRLRFKNPLPPQKWNHTLDARTEFHGACAQAHIVHKHALYGVEDCLYLNIYTPYLPILVNEYTYLKPVIVWIHGYAFTSSFSHIHGADFLIENDVLLVTVCHRIGVFGFLKLNDTDRHGNMGLKDIVAALKWIRSNIKYFGGDKNKITIMSSGSAATLISLLMMTESRKLFSKLILQSGTLFSPSIFQGDYKLERQRLLENLRNKDIQLKTALTKDVIMASIKIYASQEMVQFQRPVVPFTPISGLDTNNQFVLSRSNSFYESLKGISLNKSILIGFNSQESISEVIPFIHNPRLLRSFGDSDKFMVPFSDGCSYNINSRNYRSILKKIKDRYFKTGLSEKSIDNFVRYTSDLIKFPVLRFIKNYVSLGDNNMYVYKFDYKGNLNAVKATSLGDSSVKLKGVASGDELCYLLTCQPLLQSYLQLKRGGGKDKDFIKQITKLWANFAKFGVPISPTDNGNITWPPTSVKNEQILFIGNSIKIIDPKAERAMYHFWDGIYEKYYKAENCKSTRDEL